MQILNHPDLVLVPYHLHPVTLPQQYQSIVAYTCLNWYPRTVLNSFTTNPPLQKKNIGQRSQNHPQCFSMGHQEPASASAPWTKQVNSDFFSGSMDRARSPENNAASASKVPGSKSDSHLAKALWVFAKRFRAFGKVETSCANDWENDQWNVNLITVICKYD